MEQNAITPAICSLIFLTLKHRNRGESNRRSYSRSIKFFLDAFQEKSDHHTYFIY
uniref:Methyltransferase n=1 Tax=Rhizophora mucronata TaxID=61149 RepID=A0A2P2LHM9_RHIMU